MRKTPTKLQLLSEKLPCKKTEMLPGLSQSPRSAGNDAQCRLHQVCPRRCVAFESTCTVERRSSAFLLRLYNGLKKL